MMLGSRIRRRVAGSVLVAIVAGLAAFHLAPALVTGAPAAAAAAVADRDPGTQQGPPWG
jgi:hypothetical protein